MILTTPQTPYFDEKHRKYENSDDSTTDQQFARLRDDEELSTSTTDNPLSTTTFESETTTEIINLDEIKENSSSSKNSSFFINSTEIVENNFNENTNEIKLTNVSSTLSSTTIATPAIFERKEKKGKYLQNSESATENSISPSHDSLWALAAMKNVEQMTSKTGQSYNLTETNESIGKENDTFITKSIADWVGIMGNTEYNNESLVDTTIETYTTPETNHTEHDDVVAYENKVISFTLKSPKLNEIQSTSVDNLDDFEGETEIDSNVATTTTSTGNEPSTVSSDAEDPMSVSVSESSTVSYSSPIDEHDDDEEVTVAGDSIDGSLTDLEDFTFETNIGEKEVQTSTENNFIVNEPTSDKIDMMDTQGSSNTPTFASAPTFPEATTRIDNKLDITNTIERSTEKTRGNIRYTTVGPIDKDVEPAEPTAVVEQEVPIFVSISTEAEQKTTSTSTSTTTTKTTTTTTEAIETAENITHSPSTVHQPIEGEANPDADKPDVNAIIAISVSVVGVIALVLLVGFLYVMRKRQKQLTYGQRCRPVGLDAYSLDNVSVYNSVRRKTNLRLSKRSYGNSAFEDPSLKPNPLNIQKLIEFVQQQNIIYDEFKDIPMITARVDEVPKGCEEKNRYANVVPLNETRVLLKQLNSDETTEYINANYIKGPKDTLNYYIACQAPLDNTISDFWRMIWEQNSKVIIMATDLEENGIEKCADYLPPSVVLDCQKTFDDFQVN